MNKQTQKVHFIAIGGSIMHSLAIALHEQGHLITGSDDELFEPSRSRLASKGLLPAAQGWDESRITPDLDAVILGMHARKDNPELLRAQELKLPVYSFPEFLYQQAINKQRVVIAGSHGKTTITAIILHVLQYFDRKFDYAIGASLEGFENTVRLSDAPVIIIEGDEYLTSPLDPRPKFMHYQHHIGLISGIEWDHINVFPTLEDYVKQFDLFADATPKAGALIYCEEDAMASVIASKEREDVAAIGYRTHTHLIDNGQTYLDLGDENIHVRLIGKHNMANISGAREVLKRIGISEDQFYAAIQSFSGAKNRLELVHENAGSALFKDYAHAPSKVRATTLALREQYPDRELVACLELHTFSSLNKEFLEQYEGSLKFASQALVYFNPRSLEKKKLPAISEEDIKSAFKINDLRVFTDSDSLVAYLNGQSWTDKNLLMMSSGTFNQLDYQQLKETLNG
jgi:UDP-N-acetylmuramate: L-alanyl-gamma-D-glutamyl-meso-diaminopimelate ligase